MSLKIDEWRRLRNLSQSELGKRLGVSSKTIYEWEKDPGIIQIRRIPEIAAALEVEPSDIIFLPSDRN